MERENAVAKILEELENGGSCACVKIACGLDRSDEIDRDCKEMTCADCKSKWVGIFSAIIDEELIKATYSGIEESLEAALSAVAEENGWPKPKEGEGATAYIKRCFLPRPLYEDEEPVQFDGEVSHPRTGETVKISNMNMFYDGGFFWDSAVEKATRFTAKASA